MPETASAGHERGVWADPAPLPVHSRAKEPSPPPAAKDAAWVPLADAKHAFGNTPLFI